VFDVPRVRSGGPDARLQLLAYVASYEQGDEGADRRRFESSGYLIEALVNSARVQVVVELLMHAFRDGVQIRVEWGSAGDRVSRQETGHGWILALLDAGLGNDTSGLCCTGELGVVADVLFGAGLGKVGDGVVEAVT
jgi:hypothetical protein